MALSWSLRTLIKATCMLFKSERATSQNCIDLTYRDENNQVPAPAPKQATGIQNGGWADTINTL